MKKNERNYKAALEAKNGLNNEVIAEAGTGTATNEALQVDTETTGAFQEAEKDLKDTATTQTAEVKTEEPTILTAVVKAPLSLEEKLRAIENLHRTTVQRDNLLERINALEEFEVDLIGDADELESNHFTGCRLILQDGKGRQFVTNTGNLIKMTAEFIKDACYKRKAEIEKAIVFPN